MSAGAGERHGASTRPFRWFHARWTKLQQPPRPAARLCPDVPRVGCGSRRSSDVEILRGGCFIARRRTTRPPVPPGEGGMPSDRPAGDRGREADRGLRRSPTKTRPPRPAARRVHDFLFRSQCCRSRSIRPFGAAITQSRAGPKFAANPPKSLAGAFAHGLPPEVGNTRGALRQRERRRRQMHLHISFTRGAASSPCANVPILSHGALPNRRGIRRRGQNDNS